MKKKENFIGKINSNIRKNYMDIENFDLNKNIEEKKLSLRKENFTKMIFNKKFKYEIKEKINLNSNQHLYDKDKNNSIHQVKINLIKIYPK